MIAAFRVGVAGAALAASGACSSSQETGPAAPTAGEEQSVAEAKAMIPDAEVAAATEGTSQDGSRPAATPPASPTPKPAYQTPVPGAERAK